MSDCLGAGLALNLDQQLISLIGSASHGWSERDLDGAVALTKEISENEQFRVMPFETLSSDIVDSLFMTYKQVLECVPVRKFKGMNRLETHLYEFLGKIRNGAFNKVYTKKNRSELLIEDNCTKLENIALKTLLIQARSNFTDPVLTSELCTFLDPSEQEIRNDDLEELFAALKKFTERGFKSASSALGFLSSTNVTGEFNKCSKSVTTLLISNGHFKSHSIDYAEMFRLLIQIIPDEFAEFMHHVDWEHNKKKFLQDFASGTHNGKSGIEIINLLNRSSKDTRSLVMVCGDILECAREQFVEEFDFVAFIEKNFTRCDSRYIYASSYLGVIFPLINNKIVMQKIFEVMPVPYVDVRDNNFKEITQFVTCAYYNHGFITSAPDIIMNFINVQSTYRGQTKLCENRKRYLNYESQAHGKGSVVVRTTGCYGRGTHTGEYLYNSIHGEGVWISLDKKLKAVGFFTEKIITWECSGKLYDTKSNTVIFEGDFSSDGALVGQRNYSDGSKYNGRFKEDLRHGEGTHTDSDGSIYSGGFKEDLRHGEGTYTNSTGKITESGEWHEGKKNSLFIETTAEIGKISLYYEDDVFCGGYAYKRPRSKSLFFNSLKKRVFRVKEGILSYYEEGSRAGGGVKEEEKGHLDLQHYDVYDSKSKHVVCKEPYSIVLRCVNTVGLFEKKEIVLNFEKWKSNWEHIKELWLKLIRDGIDDSLLRNRTERKGKASGFSNVFNDKA